MVGRIFPVSDDDPKVTTLRAPDSQAWLMLGRIDQALRNDEPAIRAMSTATLRVISDLQQLVEAATYPRMFVTGASPESADAD